MTLIFDIISTEIGCTHNSECPVEQACINSLCQNPCADSSPCGTDQECQVHNHDMVCVKVCQCQRSGDCPAGTICDGCNCVLTRDSGMLSRNALEKLTFIIYSCKLMNNLSFMIS